MDTHKRLRQLLDERGWTEYRLSKECGLSESTLANIFRRNTLPSISTLEAICAGFGITISQFFADGDMVEMTPENFSDNLGKITEMEKALVADLKAMLGIYAKVKLVAPKTIARSEGKAVRIIDKRKI